MCTTSTRGRRRCHGIVPLHTTLVSPDHVVEVPVGTQYPQTVTPQSSSTTSIIFDGFFILQLKVELHDFARCYLYIYICVFVVCEYTCSSAFIADVHSILQ